ncbi:MAG: hypothetical protein A2Y61_08260 [Chloroflexi bacterium RBG_13_60_13]|nr:MAG: hypothetical protein A2Y61_08260 [Chloroflexi bacterium RBG_13_60_13]
MNALGALRRWWPLFLISSLGLFLEMVVVRWIAAEVRLIAYFKNLPLLAAFLGLSIGFFYAGRKRDYLPTFVPLLGLYVILVLAVGRVLSPRALAYPGAGDEFLWFTGDFSYWLALFLFVGVVVIFFFATMFLFVPVGQATGREMASQPPVPAYIVNILGSLAGIWVFALLAYLDTPPAVWFGMGLAGMGVYLAPRGGLSRGFVSVSAVVVIGLVILGRGIVWSPYQRLDLVELYLDRTSDSVPVRVGYTLKVQQVFHLVALDLSESFLAGLDGEIPMMEGAALTYNLPYRVARDPGRVLVVGAGMGNDVAAALRAGADRVDAVEIDPAIAALGLELHPEHPFSDPRVYLVIDDARAYLQRSQDRYDLIAFGYLDSQTLLSGLSSVRLDSYVYTVESFVQARDHLANGGVVTLSFAIGAPWIEQRLGQMLIEVFGADNVFVQKAGMGTTFVVGSLSQQTVAQNELSSWRPSSERVPVTTDDWPYLYLRDRTIPAAYWQVLLVIGLICIVLIARSFPDALRPLYDFWLLGAAFLLIEFKSITELALLFGTTWFVNVLAISGVLVMALGANLIILRLRRVNLQAMYILLFASLTLAYIVPADLLVGLPFVARVLGGSALLSLPLLFAGLVFSESLRRTGDAVRPLASNLSGSVVGGALEYGSMITGVKSLYIVAAVVYLGAWVAARVQRR